MRRRLAIGWKVSTLNTSLASLRYRAMLPLLALEHSGYNERIFSRPRRDCLVGQDALIIVKSFTLEDYWLAQEACKMKVPVIFDLCDNIFIEQYHGKNQISPADLFLLIADHVNAITVTTEPLADIVREKTGGKVPVHVIPDGIETTALLAAAKRRLMLPRFYEFLHELKTNSAFSRLLHKSKGKLALLKTGSIIGTTLSLMKSAGKVCRGLLCHPNWKIWARFSGHYYGRLRVKAASVLSERGTHVKTAPVHKSEEPASGSSKEPVRPALARRILWFGNHGAKHANFGMLDLLIIREQLEKLAAEFPLELVVISNNYEKYKKHIRPMAIPSHYVEWSTEAVDMHLQSADVVVIPNSLDAFSICKSANRTVKALAQGKPVVATATPALEELRDCIVLDDFEGGIRRYLIDAEFTRMHVQRGRQRIEQLYGQHAIVRLWGDLIEEAVRNKDRQDKIPSPDLIIVVQLPQDIDLAKPLLDAAYGRGIRCAVLSSLAAIQRWPQLACWIRSLAIAWRVFPENLKNIDNSNIFPDSTYALLSITETNLNPHRFAHQLTKIANTAGLYTATMQHGYENVGLTYSDDEHDIKHIRFASRRIFTWGHLETLHPHIPQQTLKKCFPVGCPKPESVVQVPIRELVPDGGVVVGIFENLHWQRYSDEYRKFFLDGVLTVADAFPDVSFLIKPHNAGMWLTSRYQGSKLNRNNLIIVDPEDSQWGGITAPQLLGQLDGVITTPSTVALDAARIKIPTAVVAQGIELKNYAPLRLLQRMVDWIDFIRQIIDTNERNLLQMKSAQFTDRVLLSGDATWRIIEEIMLHKQNISTRNVT